MEKKFGLVAVRPNLRVECTEWSDGSTDTPPIIFLHGVGGAMEMYVHYTFPVLEAAGAQRIIALNWPGYGNSGRLSRHTVIAYKHVLLDFLRVQNIPQCHLVGISLGASVALAFAAEYPGRVLTVTAQGAVYNGKQQFSSAIMRTVVKLLGIGRHLPKGLEGVIMKIPAHPWVVGFLGRVFNPTDLKLLDEEGSYRRIARRVVRNASVRAYVENVQDLMSFQLDGLAQISMPTLLTDGANTNWKAVRSIEKISLLVPEGIRHTVLIPRAGHLAPYTNPREFVLILLDFIRRSRS